MASTHAGEVTESKHPEPFDCSDSALVSVCLENLFSNQGYWVAEFPARQMDNIGNWISLSPDAKKYAGRKIVAKCP